MLQCSNLKNFVKVHCPSLCLYFISIQEKKVHMAWMAGWNHDRAVLKLLTSAFSRKD